MNLRSLLGPTARSRVGWVALGAIAGAAVVYALMRGPSGGSDLTAAPIHLDGSEYLAIGDSYAAGEGVTPYQSDSGDGAGGDRCHRSQQNYARQLTFTPSVQVVDHSCSGAKLGNIFDTVQQHKGIANRFGIQLGDGWRSSDIGLVTISMGGNDADFASVLRFCIHGPSCIDRPYKDGLTLRAWAAAKLPAIAAEAQTIYTRIAQGDPQARILVMGYPHLFPESELSGPGCGVVADAFDPDERAFIRTATSLMNAGLENAAVAAGVEFLQTKWVFAGHEECSTGADWVRSLDLGQIGASFHPTVAGQAAYARLISCYLNEYPAQPTVGSSAETGGASGYAAGGPEDDQLLGCARGTVS